jgi:hypothetical protein
MDRYRCVHSNEHNAQTDRSEYAQVVGAQTDRPECVQAEGVSSQHVSAQVCHLAQTSDK